jgi:hypothetical protein
MIELRQLAMGFSLARSPAIQPIECKMDTTKVMD